MKWICRLLRRHWFEHVTPTHNRVCRICGVHDCRGPARGWCSSPQTYVKPFDVEAFKRWVDGQ